MVALQGDLSITLPLQSIEILSHGRAPRVIAVQVSMDARDWATKFIARTDRLTVDLHNASTRYVRLISDCRDDTAEARSFEAPQSFFQALGIERVSLVSGRGVLAIPAPEWSEALPQGQGWTGGDGIYSFDLAALDDRSRVAFVFGDSFIGCVDPTTRQLHHDVMINNCMAVLDGHAPEAAKFRFFYPRQPNQTPVSLFTPDEQLGLRKDAYFWMQDGVLIGAQLHFLPLIVVPNPQGREGFEFAFEGTVHLTVGFNDGQVNLDSVTQALAPMRYRAGNGRETIFASAYLRRANYPQEDEMLYAYGVQSWETHRPVAARVIAKDFARFDRWTYWDGRDWVADPKAAVPIAPAVSSEFSVSYCDAGFYAGQYVLIWQQWGPGGKLAMYTADQPEGPFESHTELYYPHEAENSGTIYVYNAKAHLPISAAGELLVSYNVNTTSWAEHETNADIYHPRFVRLIQLQ